MSLKTWHMIGLFLTLILGPLLHFTYSWSGQQHFVALFSPVNESVWEHQKLLAMPFFLFTVIEYAVYGKFLPNFFAVKLVALLLGIFTIAGLFYSYSGILGTNYLPLDIGTFFAGVIVAYLFSLYSFRKGFFLKGTFPTLAGPLFLLLLVIFFLFTFYPPKLGLFYDSVSGTYGIKRSV